MPGRSRNEGHLREFHRVGRHGSSQAAVSTGSVLGNRMRLHDDGATVEDSILLSGVKVGEGA
ncbi:MAG: hypothetical protein IPG43_06200 [Proteobacteria bacterium]|nr:hypothetical protein [Pseudomonadota bacterium]